jgi:hypothetical protein
MYYCLRKTLRRQEKLNYLGEFYDYSTTLYQSVDKNGAKYWLDLLFDADYSKSQEQINLFQAVQYQGFFLHS